MKSPNVRVHRTELEPAEESNIDIRPIMHGEGAIIFRSNGKDEMIFPIEEGESDDEQIEVSEDSPRYKLLLCATFLSDPGLMNVVAGRIKPSVS